MKPLNCLIFMLVLEVVGLIFVNGKSLSVLQQSSDLAAVTAKIIKSCYGKDVKEIGLAGDVSDSFMASISSDNLIATVLINGNESSVQHGVVSRLSRYKLQVFAVAAPAPLDLKRILVGVRSSRWWNHMAQFYIFDSSDDDSGCSKAYGFLWTAWIMDILGAKVVCQQGAGEPLIYAFNPYTDYAPSPWKLEQTYRGHNNHPWALLVRQCHERRNLCENIDFDPTENLGGYEIRLSIIRADVFPNFTRTSTISPVKQFDTALRLLRRYMNVTLKMVLHENESYGYIDEDGKGHGILRDLTDGRSDIVWIVVPLAAVLELPGRYPHLYQKMFAVTQYTHYWTQWQKVISAIDQSSRIAVCTVIIVNVIVLKYVLRQSFMTAILNTVRMICNSCLTKLPNNSGPRIYLAGLFCVVVVIQALYQGQLAALLTKQIRFPNINDKQDLIESNYVIYGWHNDSMIFSDPAFEGRFVAIAPFGKKCTDHVLMNSSIACVSARGWLIDDAIKSKLHMSAHPVFEAPTTLVMKINWPLEARFNRHHSHFFESGVFDYHSERNYAAEHRILDLNENANSHEDYKILTLADLDFAFVILGFGLGCATISFLIECYIGRRRSLKIKTRRRLQRQRNQLQSEPNAMLHS